MPDLTYHRIDDILTAASDGRQILDLKGVLSMDLLSLLLLDLLITSPTGDSLVIRWPETNRTRAWMRDMGFFDDVGIQLRSGGISARDHGARQPLTRIEHEIEIGRVVDAFEQQLRLAYPVSESSRRTLVSIMIEMFQNIPHHSNATGEMENVHGIAAMQNDADSIALAIADRGIGIRRSLELREGISNLSDEDALYQVVVTGKSRHVDPGHGGELQKISQLTRLWGGEFVVRSGTSLFVAYEDCTEFRTVVPFPGLQMCLRLPRRLFEEEPVEFNERNAFNDQYE